MKALSTEGCDSNITGNLSGNRISRRDRGTILKCAAQLRDALQKPSRNRMPSPPLLAADVGNSRIKYGWFVAESSASGMDWLVCREFTATPLDAPVPVEQLHQWSGRNDGRLVLAGSNPHVVDRVAADWKRLTGTVPWLLRDRAMLPLS